MQTYRAAKHKSLLHKHRHEKLVPCIRVVLCFSAILDNGAGRGRQDPDASDAIPAPTEPSRQARKAQARTQGLHCMPIAVAQRRVWLAMLTEGQLQVEL